MKVLILGSGGREHALASKCLQDPQVKKVIVAPGNAGMLLTPNLEIWPQFNSDNIEDLAKKAKDESIELTIIGAEAFAYAGAKDLWLSLGLCCLGPDRESAKLEQSKNYSKEILKKAGIKTAKSKEFSSYHDFEKWASLLSEHELSKWVFKADGPQLGKGVFLPNNKNELAECLDFFSKMSEQHYLAEQRLHGVEISAFALIQGKQTLYLGDATDYKRLLDGDQGPNTGGMGSIAPSPYLSSIERSQKIPALFQKVAETLCDLGHPYNGFLFAGILKENVTNDLYVLEFNVRMGDPETQSLSLLWPQDTASRLYNWEQLRPMNDWPIGHGVNALHVVVAAPNYPGLNAPVQTNLSFPIENFNSEDGVTLFSAGLKSNHDKKNGLLEFVNQGGRVLGLSAKGQTHQQLRDKIYRHLSKDIFKQGQWRTDIGAIL